MKRPGLSRSESGGGSSPILYLSKRSSAHSEIQFFLGGKPLTPSYRAAEKGGKVQKQKNTLLASEIVVEEGLLKMETTK